MTARDLLAALPVPVIAAPMAGGPSTPELVAAVVRAGGGGFLAGGMRTAAQIRWQVDVLRALLGGDGGKGDGRDGGDGHDGGLGDGPDNHALASRWGVNLFVPDAVNTAIPDAARTPQARAERLAAVAAYREALLPEAAAMGVEVPTAEDATPDDDADRAAFEAMLDAAQEQAWPMVSFTFGLPAPEVFARLTTAGIPAGVTVTSGAEARAALAHGAAFLVAQGPEAGGHRGTLDPATDPGAAPLEAVLAEVLEAMRAEARAADRVPVIAAGAVADADRVRALLDAGAAAVAAGTAFLRTPEAGTSAAHRAALARAASGQAFTHDDGAAATALTRAYSGRWARSLRTPFMDRHPDAPAAYPEVNALAGPIRTAATAAGDLSRVHLWAGVQAHRAREVPAAVVLAGLDPR